MDGSPDTTDGGISSELLLMEMSSCAHFWTHHQDLLLLPWSGAARLPTILRLGSPKTVNTGAGETRSRAEPVVRRDSNGHFLEFGFVETYLQLRRLFAPTCPDKQNPTVLFCVPGLE